MKVIIYLEIELKTKPTRAMVSVNRLGWLSLFFVMFVDQHTLGT
ncbi:hypothetical protein SAMN05192533_1216 [Mesobacillus persicus]|uniref:Uncharacterized protein n=1 Tax=Mesobacillus persicus TaxID=930146 RepID=A0A1H8JFT3_9BACI|nr:hypothetical protein [Mesobacillus persicus]SEN79285.1 hypothetical protein SAMN05192533_1216 [Mesobacillus persicus]